MRCEHELLGGASPPCCLEAGHDGPHRYKCSGEWCPGLPYPASVLAHPPTCTDPLATVDRSDERATLEERAAAIAALELHRRRFTLGTRIRTLRGFSGVPNGTEGVVDEHYDGGVMVAWDLPHRPLSPGGIDYAKAIRGGMKPRPQFVPGAPLRDGFSYEELKYLAVLPEEEASDA